MAITKDEIKKLGVLSRVELTDKEAIVLQKDLGGILDFVRKISEPGETPGVNESETPGVKEGLELSNVMRDDEKPHKPGEYSEDLLKQLPDIEDGFVKVKKII